MISALLSNVAGVDPTTLAKHEAPARATTHAIGIALLFVTFPLAMLSMMVYASANLVAADLPQTTRWLLIGSAALIWAGLITFGLDRTLLVLADATDDHNRWSKIAMVTLRLTIAVLLSSLVADEISLWHHRAPIAETANQMAIESRESTARQLRGIHGIEAKEQAMNASESSVVTLRAERTTLPEAVTALQFTATRCGGERDAISQRYVALRVRAQEDTGLVPSLAALGQKLADKRRECGKLLAEASAAKAAYLNEKDKAIAEASAQAKEAATTLNSTRKQLDREQSTSGAATTAAWRDGSSREAAFTRVKSERADIRHTAWVLRGALLLLELLPMLLKMLAVNNPVSAATRNQLHAASARERMQSAQTAQFESLWTQTLAGDGATQDAVKQILALQDAAAPLSAFDHLLHHADETARRVRARSGERRGVDFETAFLDAQAAAFERLGKSYA